jgi:hypothetical protein
MTACQIVPRGFAVDLQVTPIGEAKVASQQDILATGKRPASMGGLGGLDLSQVGKTLPVYRAQGNAGFMLKTPPGTKTDQEDPPLLGDTLIVNCVRDQCAWWGEEQQDCRAVTGTPAAALAAARGLLNRTNDNHDSNTEGLERPEETKAE